MRALIWIVEDTWAATVAEASRQLPSGAEITLLYVADAEAESVVRGARQALLGRPRQRPETEPLRSISSRAAEELLAEARARLGRPAVCRAGRGRTEREVIAAAEGMDLLILARDGDRSHLGPRSLGPVARFVVDHAPCSVLLVWPDIAPSVATIPPPPRGAAEPTREPGRR